tara:strand:- start:88513 stop:89727 length:1215 start_codon:yes stop_codon:yes gene_type:complete
MAQVAMKWSVLPRALNFFDVRLFFFFRFVIWGWCLYMPTACDASQVALKTFDIFSAIVAVCASFLASAEVFGAMPYFVGVIVPPERVEVPSGYALDSVARMAITLRLRGLPITVQHGGVQAAVAAVLSRPAGTLDGVSMRGSVVHAGVVRHGWMSADGAVWVIFEVFAGYERVLWLIAGGHLQALSLSHVGTSTPVEVSLCSVPARDFCFLRACVDTLEAAFAYKAKVDRCEHTSTRPFAMETTGAAAPTASQLEQIIGSLPETERTLVMARFTEMMGKVDDARAASAASKKRLSAMTEIKETDKRMFTEQFKYLIDMLPDASKYAVTPDTCRVLQDATPEVVHHVGQLLKCASARLAETTVDYGAGRSMKRVRSETTPPDAAVPPSASAELTPLQRALANTFN